MKRIISWSSIWLVLFGCAHTVVFNTTPPGATVEINGVAIGKTPCTFRESTHWGKTYIVSFSRAGYKPLRVELTQDQWNGGEIAGWVIGGLFFLFPFICIGSARQLHDSYHFDLIREGQETGLLPR